MQITTQWLAIVTELYQVFPQVNQADIKIVP
jgi:hypothetical protein